MSFVLAAATMTAADELETDWIAQDGAATNGVSHESWRAEMLARREKRLAPVAAFAKKWVYCRHYVMGGSHYAYTEALSDAKGWHNYIAIGSSLCMAEYDPSGLWKETVLLETKEGCFRDVDVSPDGTRILYSFKASEKGDDFHLYEWNSPRARCASLRSARPSPTTRAAISPTDASSSTRRAASKWWTA